MHQVIVFSLVKYFEVQTKLLTIQTWVLFCIPIADHIIRKVTRVECPAGRLTPNCGVQFKHGIWNDKHLDF